MNRLRRLTLKKLVRCTAALVVLALVLCVASDAGACPTCKDGLAENDPSAQAMAAGYFYSILFMMAMPFVIIGTFGSFAYLSVRRAREAQPFVAEAENDSPQHLQ